MYRRKKWQRELQKHNIEKGCCICGSLFHALMMADTVAGERSPETERNQYSVMQKGFRDIIWR